MMKDEMEKQLMEKADAILGGLMSAVKTTADVAAEQLPLLAQEYLRFALVWETGVFLILCGATYGCYWFGRKWYDWVDHPSEKAAAFITAAPASLLAFGAVSQLREVLLVWTAPKIYLLENIARLLK
jgi:hypothetical protein